MTSLTSCRACGACCQDHSVLVTFRDLREIHAHYPSMDVADLIVLYAPRETYGDLPVVERFHPRVLTEEGGRTAASYLGLRFEKLPGGTTRCPFLEGGSNKCTIHEHKPLVGRTYPYFLDEAGEIRALARVRCGVPWHVPSDPNQRTRLHALLRTAYFHHARFVDEVTEWNAGYEGKALDDFLAFTLAPRPYDDYCFAPGGGLEKQERE